MVMAVAEGKVDCKTWVFPVKRRYNNSSIAFDSQDKSQAALVHYVRHEWTNMLPQEQMPDDADDIVKSCFNMTGESFEIINDELLI